MLHQSSVHVMLHFTVTREQDPETPNPFNVGQRLNNQPPTPQSKYTTMASDLKMQTLTIPRSVVVHHIA